MLVFSIMGGVGLIVLPYDLMNEFIFRPKPCTADEFKKRTRILLPRILKLRDQGKKLDD
jgi:LMBR1 domain-containing protein 1